MDVTEKVYRTIVRLARQRGYSYASQERIGEYVDRTDRTVRRHLRILEAEGVIRIERPNRNAVNRIVIIGEHVRSDVRSRVRSDAGRSVRSYRETIKSTDRPTTRTPQATETLPAVPAPEVLSLIEKLTERGVAIRVAHQLVAEHPAEAIEKQILALEHRRPRDPAATLVTAIREGWSPPVSLLDVLNRKRKDDERATAQCEQRERDDAEVAHLEKTRLDALQRLHSMPADERAALEARARAEVRERTARFVATDSIIFERMVAAKMAGVITESGSRAMVVLP